MYATIAVIIVATIAKPTAMNCTISFCNATCQLQPIKRDAMIPTAKMVSATMLIIYEIILKKLNIGFLLKVKKT